MKKILLVILAVLISGGLVQAAGSSAIIASYVGASNIVSQQGLSSNNIGTAITAGQTVVVNTRGTLVYNVITNATSANAECDLYDSATAPILSGNGLEVPVYEVKTATSGDSRTADMSGSPLRTFNGLTVISTNATCYINGQY